MALPSDQITITTAYAAFDRWALAVKENWPPADRKALWDDYNRQEAVLNLRQQLTSNGITRDP